MESTLEKFGLRKNYVVKLNSSQNSFYQSLKASVYEKELNFWIFFSERYIKTDKPYVGTFSYSKFEIKRRTKFMDSKQNQTIASGKYYEQGDKLRVEVSLGILPSFVQFYLISALLGMLTVILLAPRLFESEEFNLFIIIFPLVFLVAVAANLVVYRNKLKSFEKGFSQFLKGLESDS
jgi:hypothetical protein